MDHVTTNTAADHTQGGQHASDLQHDTQGVGGPQQYNSSEEPPRKRARLSCNTCKARKTKCVGIEDGACQYCRSLGIPCEVDLKSRKRPFYRVSGEVYEYSIKLLRCFVPEEELPELTVENIQGLLEKLAAGGSINGSSTGNALPASAASTAARHQPPALLTAAGVSDELSGAGSAPVHHHLGGDGVAARSNNEMMEADDHPLLQEELGCMLLDSMGKYRYVGPDSSIRWNHAARMARADTSPRGGSDFTIIRPLKTGLLPPTTPESGRPGSRRRGEMYLAPRQLCMAYAARFFDQVHCLYWFYSAEQFYTRLDQTLDDRGTTASASWLCALYSVFAMGSARPRDAVDHPGAAVDAKTSLEYLSMARELSTGAADEADVDSIKAFGLLSLATHATCYSVTAYLHLGTAVRIGFSLGLHRDVSPKSKDSLEREWGRRLWWTIYVLDYEMASRFGYPCSVIEDAVFMRCPPATEQILDPGPNTPLGFQALLVSLVQLRKKISHECFLEPAQVGGRLPISRVTRCLAELRRWLDEDVPSHLRWDSSLHPQHRRAVSTLHLRYWTSVIHLTRPFLLFTVANRSSSNTMIPAKRKLYDQMSNTCVSGAEAAVQILRRMRDERTLSSVMLLDCHCIGEVAWVLILALQKRGSGRSGNVEHRQELLRFCLDTLKGMERIGWCEKVWPEFEARVNESGVLGVGGGGGQQQAALELVHQAQTADNNALLATSSGAGQMLDDGTGGMGTGVSPLSQTSAGNQWDYGAVNIDGLQFDCFETLDFHNTRPGLMDMDMFMDASFSGSQFLFDNLDGTYQP
ncbi:fungal-specific transcription factor domain-containing protein [Podospora didyma]|uniref:Fungal-specific transcription factor domain-containing protein n=1 Tax=Podospora didyma TaxID=330526 RepID=A0AAE0K0C8_9PEZI|nr:fungal-specific transcription factor domain-containing protein [Podospora didyma]